MIVPWGWLWLVFVCVFLMTPLGYGWGYRRWGAPYPRYIQRRRAGLAAQDAGDGGDVNHHAWGWSGDFVWVVAVIALVWIVAAW